ncbi:MAG: hypothetical protein ACO1OG_05225 [Devosia sp.]
MKTNCLKQFIQLAAVAFGMALAGTSTAQAVTCPSARQPGVQQFTVSSVANVGDCIASGTGNLNPAIGSAGTGPLAAYVVIDTTSEDYMGSEPEPLSVTGINWISGEYTLLESLWSDFSSLVLVLLSVETGASPDWVAFLLPSGNTSGDWFIDGVRTPQVPVDFTLDRAILYGTPIASVPVPAGIVLLGGGLAMLGLLGRRRRSVAAT